MFFYSDKPEPFSGNVVPYERQNANVAYMRHYDNYLYLNFVMQFSGSHTEVHQAQKELAICERKLRHWYQHRNFQLAAVLPLIEKAKKQWQQPNAKVIK